MKTIDDLSFPPMDEPPKKIKLKTGLVLPNGFAIAPGKEIELSHTGIHAIVKIDNDEFRF